MSKHPAMGMQGYNIAMKKARRIRAERGYIEITPRSFARSFVAIQESVARAIPVLIAAFNEACASVTNIIETMNTPEFQAQISKGIEAASEHIRQAYPALPDTNNNQLTNK